MMAAMLGSHPARTADNPFQSKTLNLRSGPITLEPTQQPAFPKESPPSSPIVSPEKLPDSGARWLSRPAPSSEALSAPDNLIRPETSAPITDAVPKAGRTISSDRVILSFERRVTAAEQEALQRNGIEVGEFLGGTAYTGRVGVREIEQLVRASKDINTVEHVAPIDERNAHIKIDPSLARTFQEDNQTTSATGITKSSTNVVVQLWPEANFDDVRRQLERYGTIQRVSPTTNRIELSVPNTDSVRSISALKDVQYIGPALEPKAQNTHVRNNIGVDAAVAAPHFLSGSGVRVGIWDQGHVGSDHPSFTGRLSFDLALEGLAARKDNRHATHVAGTIAGSGVYVSPVAAADSDAPIMEKEIPGFGKVQKQQSSGQAVSAATSSASPGAAATSPDSGSPAQDKYPGVAPAAEILSFEFSEAPDKLINLLRAKPDAIDVMNNSWNMNFKSDTCAYLATYGALGGPQFDAVISGQVQGQPIRRIPIVQAAGNNRDDGICGLSSAAGYPNYRTIIPPGAAKNVITVGAIDADTNEMTDFSAWGPTNNGRLKPDVVAPGCRSVGDGQSGIVSTIPATGIGRFCGTSMATPAVTGAVVLMIENMEKLGFAKLKIFPSTYKALLIHGAADLGRPGPDFEFGYGRVHLGQTLKLMDEQAFRQLKIEREEDIQTQDIAVAAGSQELKVTLVWDDRPVGILSNEALSNDLDLTLSSPSGLSHLPFLLNPIPGKEAEAAQTGVDHINVVEQVVVKNPEPGAWRISVRASKLGNAADGQTYSLVVSAQ
jgi:hypothetical protein